MTDDAGIACRYTNLTNPLGRDASNLPMLLRRFADHLEEAGIDNDAILHVVISDEVTEYGSWWDITAYYEDSDPETQEGD